MVDVPPKSIKVVKKTKARGKNCPSKLLRQQVDEISFALFMERGYDNTTMRMISEETGFGAGSLYNAFNGKEDILEDIMMTAYDMVIKKVKFYLRTDMDPVVAISFPMCVVLYSASVNKKYAELLKVAYHTWDIMNAMVDRTVKWQLRYLEHFDKGITQDEMRRKVMINAAIIGRFVFEYSEKGPMDCTEGIYMCMLTFCSLFELPADNLKSTVFDIVSLFNDEMVFGVFDVKSNFK